MRKLIIILGFLGCFFCFYGLGAYLKTNPLSRGIKTSPAPSMVSQQSITVPLPSRHISPQQAKSATPAKHLAKVIEEDKGIELVRNLQATRLEPFSRLQESMQRRFASAYPRQEHAALKEAANRVAILQAMNQYKQQAATPSEVQALAQIYQQIADDEAEHPAVRRESLRNLLQMMGRVDEDERMKVLARAGASRFLSSASRSANELLEELFKAGTP